jgi:hypothetical protein
VSTKDGHRTATQTETSIDGWMSTSEGREVARREIDPASAVRVVDLWGWLTGVAFDSRRMAASVTPGSSGPDGP